MTPGSRKTIHTSHNLVSSYLNIKSNSHSQERVDDKNTPKNLQEADATQNTTLYQDKVDHFLNKQKLVKHRMHKNRIKANVEEILGKS